MRVRESPRKSLAVITPPSAQRSPDAPVMALIGGVRVTPLRQQQPPIRRIDQSLDNLSLPALTQTTPPSLPRMTWDEAEPVMRV